jgi:hypothetical protein
MPNLTAYIDSATGEYEAYSFPGGYPLYYVVEDGGELCPPCANENRALDPRNYHEDPQWHIVAAGTNWEDADLKCDNCYLLIECAYADSEAHAIACPARPQDSAVPCTCK